MSDKTVCHINGYRVKDTEARKTAEAAAKAAEVAKKAADNVERSAYATALLANQAKSEAAGAVTTANGAANIARIAEQKADETQEAALLRTGGTMTGSLDMGGKTILNARHIDLNEGLSIKDWGSGARFVVSAHTEVRGSIFISYLENGNYRRVILNNVSDPVNDYDAANKKFVVDTIAAALDGLNEVSAPVRGTDYWTPEDQESIVQQVIAALGTPVFGRVDADNNIILTGELVDGTYTVKYEDGEGNVVEIGTLEHSVVPEPAYTNLADPTSGDWLVGYRMSSTGETKAESVTHVSNYIPVKVGDVVRVRGQNLFFHGSDSGYATQTFYNANKERIAKLTYAQGLGGIYGTSHTIDYEPTGDFVYTVANGAEIVSGDVSDIAYVRFSGRLWNGYTADDVIITVNQEITE